MQCKKPCPLCPQKRTFRPPFAMPTSLSIAEFSASLGDRSIFMKKVRCCVSDLTYGVAAANTLSAIRIAMCPIKGSVKCHANSIPAALSKLSCSAGWRCFSYLPPSYPPDELGRLMGGKLRQSNTGVGSRCLRAILGRRGNNECESTSRNADGSGRYPLDNFS